MAEKEKPKAATLTMEKLNDIAIGMFAKGFISLNNTLYRYKEDDCGIWERLNLPEGDSFIAEETFPLVARKAQISEIRNLLQIATYSAYRDRIRLIGKPSEWLNLKNCRLNVMDGRRESYSRANLAMSKTDYHMDEKMETPVFDLFLNQILASDDDTDFGESKDLVLEFIGYCLIPGNPFQVALMMIGCGGNGKGTLIKVIRKLVGDENCSDEDVKGINSGDTIHLTENKLVNFCGDVSSKEQLDTCEMKKAVEGANVTANPKYIPSYPMPFTAKCVLGANKPPFSSNTDHNVERRFIMLPMLVKFEGETRDNYLDLKLYAEMPGILAKCVAALKRLLERKSFSVPRRCKNLWLKYKTENDSVAQWIEDEPVVFKDKEKICELSSVKKMYKDFCWASGLRQVGPSELYDRLSKAGFKKGRSGDKRFIHGIRDMTNPNAPEDDTPISFVDTKTPF